MLSMIFDLNFVPMFQLVNQAIMHENLPSADVTVLQLDVLPGTHSIRSMKIIPMNNVRKALWKKSDSLLLYYMKMLM